MKGIPETIDELVTTNSNTYHKQTNVILINILVGIQYKWNYLYKYTFQKHFGGWGKGILRSFWSFNLSMTNPAVKIKG